MEPSLPPRFQFAGVPVGWSRLVPVSKVELTQKLPDTVGTTRATDKSSISIRPLIDALPPETSEQRIFTAPAGTTVEPLRMVNVEFAIEPAHPAFVVPDVTKSVEPPTCVEEPSRNRIVSRISGPLRLYISNH